MWPDDGPPEELDRIGAGQPGAAAEDVELVLFEPVEDSGSTEPGEAQLEAKPAADAVTNRPASRKQGPRASGHDAKRGPPFRGDASGVEIGITGAGPVAFVERQV